MTLTLQYGSTNPACTCLYDQEVYDDPNSKHPSSTPVPPQNNYKILYFQKICINVFYVHLQNLLRQDCSPKENYMQLKKKERIITIMTIYKITL